MNPRLLLLLPCALAACSPTPLGGVRVTVRFLDTDAQCAKVFLSNPSGFSRVGSPVKRGTRDKVVGVAQDEYTGDAVDLQAKGYLAADCSGDPIDFSKTERRSFVSGDRSADVLLVLRGGMTPDAGGGAGGGGGATGGGTGGGGGAGADGGTNDGGGGTGSDGGPDAGPSPEQCGNGADDDFDGKTDCFDPDCVPLGDCNFGRRCTMLGVCVVPPKEMGCNDGLDDDGDTLIDCLDDDCNAKSCADALACTFGETCQNKVCLPATTLVCATPNECQMGAGTCLADAGCGYASKSNGTACDGGTCTSGECQLQVPFTPSNGVPATVAASKVSGPLTLDCGVSTFNSDTLVFGNWCPGQPKPAPIVLTRPGIQNLMVLPVAGLDLKGELRLTGTLPIALLVFGDASITGRLDVSGRHEQSGAGGPASNCGLMGEPIPPTVYMAGGGGAGGFAQAGTSGGYGYSNILSGGLGGGISLLFPNVQLRGGCAGTDGAAGAMGLQAALGGGAGGAVQLTVTGTLVVDGRVMANGGGGRGGVTNNAGGGGAGSGGGILLEANLLDMRGNAKVTAHGGGGGGGARDADDGTDGQDGHADDTNPAQGGSKGGGQAGDGAAGGSTSGPGFAGNGSTSAGGGGGGGVGRIHLRSIAACQTAGGRLVSPAPTGNCP